MFTGLISSIGSVNSLSRSAGGLRLSVNIESLANQTKTGDSIAVNGICLTVSAIKGSTVEFDVSGQTVSTTTIGSLRLSEKVNIEPAMAATDKFGGHFVQGHIDAIGKVKQIRRKGDSWEFVFTADKHISDLLIAKGSIAIDGTSLTIANVNGIDFSVAVIAETFERTIFKHYKIGQAVNIETDILCRIVKKQLEHLSDSGSSVTIDKLRQAGF